MGHVICQVLVHPRRITMRWSEGDRSFEPYHLEGEDVQRFWQLAEEIRGWVKELDKGDDPQTVFSLAKLGHAFYQHIFPGEGRFAELTTEIRKWLADQNNLGAIDCLEITGDTVGRVPWNTLYEKLPEAVDFHKGDEAGEWWKNFWGCRYALGITHRVNPLRPTNLLEKPGLLWAVDPAVFADFSLQEQEQMRGLVDGNGLALLQSYQELANEINNVAPDVLFLICRAETSGLRFGDTEITAERLHDLLANSKGAQIPWNNLLVVLIPCGLPVEGWAEIQNTFHRLRLGGLILPQHPTTAGSAARFTREIARGFLEQGQTAALAMQNARCQLAPSGLLYESCFPPQLQVTGGESQPESEVENRPLPQVPYHPLVPLDQEERSLLVGREADIANFCDLLDRPQVRVALLQGRIGVGKSSLLRAGVIPFLDEEAIGYLPLRDRTEKTESTQSEKDYPVLSLRATNDMLGQLAPALVAFAGTPFSFTTPTERTVNVDLASVLRKQLGLPNATAEEVYGALRKEKDLLAGLLGAWSEQLPGELLLLIEQGEELFSLSRTGEDVKNRLHALAMLRSFGESVGHGKVIMSVSTAYLGRLMARLRSSPEETPFLGEYLLSSLNVDQLVEVIQRPTSEEVITYSSEVPFEKYGFRFEEDLPRHIAREAIQAVNEGTEESLPLVHAVCAMLWLGRESRPQQATITKADLDRTGGVRGGLGKYVEQLTGSLVKPTEKKRFWDFLEKMYAPQPDGSLTRLLLPEEELAEKWKGRTPFGQIVTEASAGGVGFFDDRVSVTERGEKVFVSLGHDLLPALIDSRQRETTLKQRVRSRMMDTLWVSSLVLMILASLGYVLGVLPARRETEQLRAELDEMKTDIPKLFQEEMAKFKVEKRVLENEILPAEMEQGQEALKQGNLLQLRKILVGQLGRTKDLPAFAWDYLWNQLHGSGHTLAGHQSPVTALALSSDGKVLLSAGSDGNLRAWKPETGEGFILQAAKAVENFPDSEASPLPAHGSSIRGLAISPGGKLFATAGDDKTIKLWEMKSVNEGKGLEIGLRSTLTGHNKAVNAVVFSTDGKLLISASDDETVKLWDVEKGKEKQILKEHKGPVVALALSPDGKTLASAAEESSVILWNLEDGKKKQELEGSGSGVAGLAFSPEGTILAGIFRGNKEGHGTIILWNPKTGKGAGKDLSIATNGRAIQFGSNDKTILVAGMDRMVSAVDVASGTITHRLQGHLGSVNCLAVDRTGKKIISGGMDSLVKVWDLVSKVNSIQGHDGPISSVALSPNDDFMVTGGADGMVKLWDLASRKEKETWPGHTGPVRAVGFGELGKKLLAASGSASEGDEPGKIIIWEAATGKIFKELKGQKGGITSLSFSENGKILVTASDAGTVKVWNVAEGKEIFTFTQHQGAVTAVTIHPSGKYVASGGEDGFIHLWNTTTGMIVLAGKSPFGDGEKPNEFLRHGGTITALSFLPFADVFLVSASADRTIKLWNPETGSPIITYTGHSQAIQSLSYGISKGRLALVSAGRDKTVKLWNTAWNREVFSFEKFSHPVNGVAMTGDQRTIITVGEDGVIRFFDAGKSFTK